MNKKIIITVSVIVLVLVILLILMSNPGEQKNTEELPNNEIPEEIINTLEARSFYMGFSAWPPAADLKLINDGFNFQRDHGDLFEYHADGGVPWVEADKGEPFSQELLGEWQSKKNEIGENQKVFLMVSSLGSDRISLAPYWGTKDNMELPDEWKNNYFGDEIVKNAYLFYLKEAIKFWEPDYLSIGSEVNDIMNSDMDKWNEYKEFHKFIYTELKKENPDLPIFSTFTIQGLRGDSVQSEKTQVREVKELLPYIDLFGVSSYPYGWNYAPSGKLDPIPEDFFDILLQFNKPIAITETGVPTTDFYALGTNYKFDEDYQVQYISFLLEKAEEHNFEFVVNYATIDFDRLLEILPPGEVREIATIWAYTGLQESNGNPKKALETWDAYYNAPFKE